MEFFIEKQLLNIVYSVILGLIFGGIYDIIRVVQILCGIASYSDGMIVMKPVRHGKRPTPAFFIFLVTDFVFMLTVISVYSFFNYWAEYGRVRFYLMFAAAAGFYIYYNTAGRLVMLCSDFIVRCIRWVFMTVVIRPVRFILKLTERALLFIMNHTVLLLLRRIADGFRQRKTNGYLKQLADDIKFCETKGKQVGI